jgi:hypothetical protein
MNLLYAIHFNNPLASGDKKESLKSDGNTDTHETCVPTCTLLHIHISYDVNSYTTLLRAKDDNTCKMICPKSQHRAFSVPMCPSLYLQHANLSQNTSAYVRLPANVNL